MPYNWTNWTMLKDRKNFAAGGFVLAEEEEMESEEETQDWWQAVLKMIHESNFVIKQSTHPLEAIEHWLWSDHNITRSSQSEVGQLFIFERQIFPALWNIMNWTDFMGAIPSSARIGVYSRYNWNQLQHKTGYLKRQARPCGQDKWHPNRCLLFLVTRSPIRRVLDNDQLHLCRFCLNTVNTVTSWSCHFRGAHLQWVIQNYIGLKWLHCPLPSSCSVCLRGGTSSRNSKSTGCGRWGGWLLRRSGRSTSNCTNGS